MALDASNAVVGDANGGVAALPDDGLPIFDVLRVQLDFSIAASFVAAQVANNVLVLALSNGRILRIDLNRPQDIDGTVPCNALHSPFDPTLLVSRRYLPACR